MPLIEARLLEGVFSADERKDLAEGLIDAVVQVKGENFRTETEVLIAEVPVALCISKTGLLGWRQREGPKVLNHLFQGFAP